jgi:hypothetical protein
LLRAAGSLASTFHSKARSATLRKHLICAPARLTRPQGQPVLRLPQHWPWSDAVTTLHANTDHPASNTVPDHRPPGPDRRPRRGKAGQTSGYPTRTTRHQDPQTTHHNTKDQHHGWSVHSGLALLGGVWSWDNQRKGGDMDD